MVVFNTLRGRILDYVQSGSGMGIHLCSARNILFPLLQSLELRQKKEQVSSAHDRNQVSLQFHLLWM